MLFTICHEDTRTGMTSVDTCLEIVKESFGISNPGISAGHPFPARLVIIVHSPPAPTLDDRRLAIRPSKRGFSGNEKLLIEG